jgi:hypothetical protein
MVDRISIRWNDYRHTWECVERFQVLAAFSKLHEAEAWVIAESQRRESVG